MELLDPYVRSDHAQCRHRRPLLWVSFCQNIIMRWTSLTWTPYLPLRTAVRITPVSTIRRFWIEQFLTLAIRGRPPAGLECRIGNQSLL